MTVTTEMPMDEPMLRTRLNRLVASARKRASSVANATVDSGTKTRPSPIPCTSPEWMIGPAPICGENPVIMSSDRIVSASPATTSSRASTIRTSRPTRIIDSIVPTPRGAITRPVVIVG